MPVHARVRLTEGAPRVPHRTMSLDELRESFPKLASMKTSTLLSKVFAHAAESEGFLVGDFCLDPKLRDETNAWFQGDDAMAEQFVILATDDANALYGYWLHDDLEIDKAPLVYLNGEGMGNTVLANSLQELLSILGLGRNTIGQVEAWQDEEDPAEGVETYRLWLRDELKIEPATTHEQAYAIVARAKKGHPDLDKVITDWLDLRASR